MGSSPYGPQDGRRVSFKRLPKGLREAGISKIERTLGNGSVTDLVSISDRDWQEACWRYNAAKALAEQPGRLGRRINEVAKAPGIADRTVRRFIAGHIALLPLKKAVLEIDKRFVEYLLELSDSVTGRIIDILRRAAYQGIADKSQKVGLAQLQYVGARISAVIGRRS
jgi:hypothetical protein